MPSVPTTESQPSPPIRTLTISSTNSQTSSPQMSPGYAAEPSPGPFMSRRSTQGSPSPTEASFFDAIASKVRIGRPRSRSRKGVPRNRSKSPLPPDQFPSSTAERSRTSAPSSPRPEQTRHYSNASHTSAESNSDQTKRPGPSPVRRNTASSDPWRGRHSNSWLFNDFSVTDHAKDLFHFGRNSRS
ncbi:hypothetical protein K432DRAFT_287223 [Lepidopterella palustris CBS 459.81]|uniref:Uncharacterized protein n=1 Tax=Lepidopterella palustris CBS 459.81 TaxID=1314670 RepID=A0A8E2EJY2_9PEZI|nr:hypothetical protein K432DRAFT_287223 [Lepidopterella palustris CBS 459.81]